MSARAFLILSLIALLMYVAGSGLGVIRRAPALARSVIDVLVIAAAVRVGLSVALLAFDSTIANIAIPLAFGLAVAALTVGRRYAGGQS